MNAAGWHPHQITGPSQWYRAAGPGLLRTAALPVYDAADSRRLAIDVPHNGVGQLQHGVDGECRPRTQMLQRLQEGSVLQSLEGVSGGQLRVIADLRHLSGNASQQETADGAGSRASQLGRCDPGRDCRVDAGGGGAADGRVVGRSRSGNRGADLCRGRIGSEDRQCVCPGRTRRQVGLELRPGHLHDKVGIMQAAIHVTQVIRDGPGLILGDIDGAAGLLSDGGVGIHGELQQRQVRC